MDYLHIELRSTGELVDALITTSLRMFSIQDEMPSLPNDKAGEKAKELQALNSKRNDLMRAITRRVDGRAADTGSDKTYK